MSRMILVLFGASLLFGCDNAECERARLQAFRAYQALHDASIQRKLAGVDAENWTAMETKTDLLRSAFATEQVTWKSADKTKAEVQSQLQSITTDNPINLEIFKRSADEAFQRQEALAKQCR